MGLLSLGAAAVHLPLRSSEPAPAEQETAPDNYPAQPPEVLAAREAALAHLAERHGEQAPAPGLIWTLASISESSAPEGSPGEVTYQFAADGWAVMISHPIGGSETVIYTVTVANQDTGFQWQGTVDGAGSVTSAGDS